jgi:nucleotide-binding universal stress UspA family protein
MDSVDTVVRTIVAPTDGSDHAMKAVTLACDLASRYEAKLILLHVLSHKLSRTQLARMVDYESLTAPAHDTASIPKSMPEFLAGTATSGKEGAVHAALEHVGDQLLEKAKEVAKSKGVTNVSTQIEEGDPVERIIGCAEREKVDLIVMGSRGLSDLKGLMVGSVSHKVGHLAECTCVTVK